MTFIFRKQLKKKNLKLETHCFFIFVYILDTFESHQQTKSNWRWVSELDERVAFVGFLWPLFAHSAIINYSHTSLHICSDNWQKTGSTLPPRWCFYTGVVLRKKESVKLETFQTNRFGQFSDDEFITSISEFTVQKLSPRRIDPVRRTLCLTEATLLERDPSTYNIITLRPLGMIAALVRVRENPQQLTIQWTDGENRSYLSTDRDSLLASLLDGAR